MELAPDATKDAMRLERAAVWAQSGDHRRAVEEAEDSLESMVANCDPRFLLPIFLQAARICGQCAALAQADQQLSEADRASLVDQYGESAVAILRQAQAAGLAMTAELKETPEFETLQGHPQFTALFTNLP